ncbi:diguanylate cyclase [Patulibacter brassicae]|uniref:Diguanylate cyclase n=1 Tax=Patulibacter brassicae TaxID=1705717 RepID=A0ABU4VPI7_9ACTN|nr:diguanylate cyclase [Patulibacter brassicae]MDX8153758.1 diguanylate cyclase [Patulibacter brassicae]
MSFRARLNLFFLLLVVVPLVAVGVVLLRTIDGAERGKVEAALVSEGRAASALLAEQAEEAGAVAAEIAEDRTLAAALRERDAAAIRERAGELLAPATDARRIRIVLPARGRRPAAAVEVGSPTALLPASRTLVAPGGGGALARIQIATIGPRALAVRLRRLTGRDVQIRDLPSGRLLAGDARDTGRLPAPGRVGTTGRGDWTAVVLRQPGFGTARQEVVLLASGTQVRASRSDRFALLGTLALFLVLAALGALVVSRSLQRQVGALLEGARRLGRGEFDEEIPTSGTDELSQLAGAFNAMSQQLRRRIEELGDERERLRSAIRRIGETFAANLDREGLLEIVASAAVDAVRADGGRAVVATADAREEALAGWSDGLGPLLDAAEQRIVQGHDGFVSDGDLHGLAVPMGSEAGIRGFVAVARRGEPFTAADAEVVAYLSGQAAVSLENVGRHEEAEREALTDPLTGLANRRRFDELLRTAVDRAQRDGQPLSLLVIDLDHFKSINDRFGHQTGDAVLREVAWVLRDGVRGLDAPARLGGEEFGVLLPATDAEGALMLAERLRESVQRLRVVTEDGLQISVTTSIGAGTVGGLGATGASLVAVADGALYEAKRSGRNRTVTADESADAE